MNGKQPSTTGCRRSDLIAAIACGLVILALTAFYGLFMNRQSGLIENRQAIALDQAEAQEIVTRGSALLGLSEPATIWTRQLTSGRTGLADYLLRVFVSWQYLAGQPDDEQFIKDLHTVLSGSSLTEPELKEEKALLSGSGSRLALINSVLANAGSNSRLPVQPEPTSLRTLSVEGTLPHDGAEVIGRLPIQVHARLTGQAAVLRLYGNGQIIDEQPAAADAPSLEQPYQLVWDTELAGSGEQQLAVLALSSDGRGSWTHLATWQIPVVYDLPAGAVLMQAGAAWFRTEPWRDGAIRLNIVQTDAPLQARLYADDNRLLAESFSAPDQPGALAARPDTDPGELHHYYLKIGPQSDRQSDETMQYTLVSAPLAAHFTDQPEEWLAVIEQGQAMVRVRDVAGRESTITPDQVSIIDPQARLSSLHLTGPVAGASAFMPLFDRETLLYALSVSEEVSWISVGTTAMEGSAAVVSLFLDQEGKQQVQVEADSVIPLEPSVNTITISVRGFDSAERTYSIFILRPPDSGGFSRVLDQFPQDWRTPLFLLHVLYPAWQFEAHQTGIDWQVFLDAQDEKDRSLIDAAHVPASWVEADSPVYDGSSWKAAERQVIAYYADPRNFLDPVNIFQFEKLTYVPALHTREGIEQILQGSFMEKGRSSIDYAGLILEAGIDADISPFFIAARIIQEMGLQGQSPLATGTLEGYAGVYNFYNIGATPNPDVPNGARINGARFALFGREPDKGEITPEEEAWLLPWTTPQRAITGGARWISGRYVAIGQDTLYGQKFDLVAEGGLFIHQYAQNIQMAWAEGRRTRRAWLDLGLIQESFTFRIPVFDNMPAEPAALP